MDEEFLCLFQNGLVSTETEPILPMLYIYIFVFVCLFVSYGIPDLFKFGQPAAPCFGVLFVRDSKGAAVYGETLPTAKAYRAPVIF
jgi:hypothetical protein